MFGTPHLIGWVLLTWTAGGAFAVSAQERDRARIPDRFKWDLTDIYPSEEAWKAAKEKLAAALPRLREFKGLLASSPRSSPMRWSCPRTSRRSSRARMSTRA